MIDAPRLASLVGKSKEDLLSPAEKLSAAQHSAAIRITEIMGMIQYLLKYGPMNSPQLAALREIVITEELSLEERFGIANAIVVEPCSLSFIFFSAAEEAMRNAGINANHELESLRTLIIDYQKDAADLMNSNDQAH